MVKVKYLINDDFKTFLSTQSSKTQKEIQKCNKFFSLKDALENIKEISELNVIRKDSILRVIYIDKQKINKINTAALNFKSSEISDEELKDFLNQITRVQACFINEYFLNTLNYKYLNILKQRFNDLDFYSIYYNQKDTYYVVKNDTLSSRIEEAFKEKNGPKRVVVGKTKQKDIKDAICLKSVIQIKKVSKLKDFSKYNSSLSEIDVYNIISARLKNEFQLVNPLVLNIMRNAYSDEDALFLINNLTISQISFLNNNFFRKLSVDHMLLFINRIKAECSDLIKYTVKFDEVNHIAYIIKQGNMLDFLELKYRKLVGKELQTNLVDYNMRLKLHTDEVKSFNRNMLLNYLDVSTLNSVDYFDDKIEDVIGKRGKCTKGYSYQTVLDFLNSAYKNSSKKFTKLPDRIYKLQDALVELGISSLQFYNHMRYAKQNNLIPYFQVGKGVRYLKEDLQDYYKKYCDMVERQK